MRPFVLGIAGGTASGKSTLTTAVSAELGERCLVIKHDRYYFSIPADFKEHPETFNFDHPDSLETDRLIRDLGALAQGQGSFLPRYDFATHLRLSDEWIEPRPIIIVEGILVLSCQKLCERFDLKLFIDAPQSIRLARRMQRDQQTRGRKPKDILEQFERSVEPMHNRFVEPSKENADRIVDGTVDVEQLTSELLALIDERTNKHG